MLKFYHNTKITFKMLLGFGLMGIFLIAVAVLGILAVQDNAAETLLLNARADNAIAGARLGENANAQRASYISAALNLVMGDMDLYQQEMVALDALEAEFAASLKTIQATLIDEQAIQYGRELETAYATYESNLARLIAVLTGEVTDEAESSRVFDATATSADEVIAAAARLTDRLSAVTDEQAIRAASNASGATGLITVVWVVALVLSVLSIVMIVRSISGPLKMMMGFLKQVGESGNLNFTDDEWRRTRAQIVYKDETSQALAAFVKMLEQLVYYGESLEKVAARDLSFDVRTLGDDDTMGNALSEMLDNLNGMFSEIEHIAAQVAAASGEVASGSQTLAQGSTEQAATVQEISASISEITAQSKNSTEAANAAAQFSGDIQQLAREGNARMDSMMTAVREINDASSAIGNVIKVIDDIAFRTNILALNAAVEATRAGQFGRGFSVVAEEVRNLAGKSADAAKETAELISTSIGKAETGLEIAKDMAESLERIVSGIERTSDSLSQIAEQSTASEYATQQVNQAVDQVSDVVQQNSATSQESAAASEEMSSQAQTLRTLIARFRLRGGAGQSLPAGDIPYQSPALHF